MGRLHKWLKAANELSYMIVKYARNECLEQPGMQAMAESTLPHDPEQTSVTEPTPGQRRPPGDDVTTHFEETRAVKFTPPERIFGDYELMVEVARGGMGVVYRARQVKLNRTVALKMILAGKLADADEVQRFRTEAEAAARLSHPNIVAVHEVGEINGQHFFSMDFIEGTSLAQRLIRGPLPGRDAARYVRQIAKAVHYAHRQGILHRDLKPSNIMLDAEDEPRITDFGLAKRLGNQDSCQTRTGAVIGTPSYMAPEQAQGKNRELGPACDIYSLGAMLYELVTGRPPFRAETPIDTVVQVIQNEPVPASLLNPNVDKDLETICHKCLEKDPALRYQTAADLAQDLQNFLDGNSINARSFNVFGRLTRMLDRSQHDANFATWGSMILIMAAVIGFQHTLIFLLMQTGAPRETIWAARTLEFVILGCLFWYNRRKSRLLPTSSIERELWTIWIGYFFALGATVVATRLIRFRDLIGPTDPAQQHAVEMLPYPFLAILSGLAFFIMGSNYWGRCYAIGVCFFALACLMPLQLDWAPLGFGLLWAGALTMVGLHLRRLARRAKS
jgi:serine/threonine protein kinase